MKRINMHIIAMLTAAAAAISLTGCANDTSARNRDDDDDDYSPRHSHTVDADENTSSNSIADILGTSNEVSSAPDAETSVTESTTAASSTADPIVSEPETSVPDANVPGNTGSADINDWPAGVATASPAAPSAPVPEADWAPILSNQEMFTAIGTNLENAESFVMTCHIEGGFPNMRSSTDLLPSEHNFTLVVTKDATYLKSTFQDLTTDIVPSVYEEYNIVEDDMLLTITENEGTWISNSAAKTEATNAKDAAVDSVHLLQLFDINSVYADLDATARRNTQTNAGLKEAPIERTDDGNIAITLPQWRKMGKLLDSDFKTASFAGLIRFPSEKLTNERTANLNKEDPGRATEGNAVCIIDNEYRLKAIEADIGMGSLYDIHVSIEFSNWNNVLPIEVPEYTVVEAE